MKRRFDALIREVERLPDEKSDLLPMVSFGLSLVLEGKNSSKLDPAIKASDDFRESCAELSESVWLF
jgi:hypothetical protein